MAKVTLKERKDKLGAVLTANEGNVLDAALIATIQGVFVSAPTSNKTNESGEVHCTYFNAYLPADQFNVNTKGKTDSMSIEGKKLHRTQKSMVNRATSEVLKQFRSKDITSAEMEELLSSIEANAAHKFPMGTEAIPADYPFSL